MQLYIGGFGQGKLSYVLGKLACEKNKLIVIQAEEFTAQTELEWEELKKSCQNKQIVWNHFHLWIKKILEENENLEWQLEQLMQLKESLFVISDEVGNGIVPIDKSDREYREQVGRCLIQLAKDCDRVERIMCGIGMQIK